MQFLAKRVSPFPICLASMTSCSPKSRLTGHRYREPGQFPAPPAGGRCPTCSRRYSRPRPPPSRAPRLPSAGCGGAAHAAAQPRRPPTALRQTVTCPGPPVAAPAHGLTVLSLQACWQPPEVPGPQGPRASRQWLPAPRGSTPPPRQRPRRRLRAAVAKAAPSSFPAQPRAHPLASAVLTPGITLPGSRRARVSTRLSTSGSERFLPA